MEALFILVSYWKEKRTHPSLLLVGIAIMDIIRTTALLIGI
jgi:hypothetical protein